MGQKGNDSGILPENQKSISDDPHPNRFKPGKSGNPAGRPKKGSAWADIRNEILSSKKIKLEIITDLDETITVDGKIVRQITTKVRKVNLNAKNKKGFRYAVLARQLQNALAGDNTAIADFMDREDGTPTQTMNLGGQEDNPLLIQQERDEKAAALLKRISERKNG